MPGPVRPTSPHWQIYRWQIGNTLSILHRITGVALAIGLIALSYWLISVAGGPDAYATAAGFFANPIGLFILIGFTFAFTYHFLNGIRHLFWDAGRGFEKSQSHASGYFAVGGAIVLTLGIWALLWRHFS